MRISTFWYCLKQGIINICRNIWFSLASVATISACIFLFCMFFGIMANVQHVVKNVESTVGVTIFFDEGMSEDEMKAIGKKIAERPEVDRMEFTSGEEADLFEGYFQTE